jgi:phage baseplate assembly protein V
MSWNTPGHRTLISRGILKSYDASGGQHLATISGLKGEEFVRVPRLQQWGQTGYPPIGSHVLFVRLGDGSDRATILGIDHADYGPKDLQEGQKALYDHHGNRLVLAGDKTDLHAVAALRIDGKDVVIKGASSITLDVDGVEVKITGRGVAITGGTITHDGHAIDKTHKHTGITPGGALTGPPS